MNYKFLSALAFFVSMYTGVKADALPKAIEKPQHVAPNLKIGYVDTSFILANLPEAIRNAAELESFKKQLDNQLEMKIQEYQEKAQAFQQQADTFTEAQRKQKMTEMSKLESDCRALHGQTATKIEEKYKTTIQPIYDKIQEVINKIAVEHAYTFILSKNTEAGPVLFFAHNSFDLSELILEKVKAIAPKEAQPPVVGPKAKLPAKIPARSGKPAKKK